MCFSGWNLAVSFRQRLLEMSDALPPLTPEERAIYEWHSSPARSEPAPFEVVKVLTGLGAPLADTLLTMDLGAMEFRRLRIRRREDCAVCRA